MRGRQILCIGTSGWHYDHWKGTFYPEELRAEDFLKFYASQFLSVEINTSFYRLPPKETFSEWKRSVPDGFVFAVKASRYITHMKKLKDPRQPVSSLLKNAKVLGDKLGPVLFQLPPRWNVNSGRLEAFLKTLPKGFRYAFEFRDTSWFIQEVYALLSRYRAAFCIYDLEGMLSPKEITSDIVYVRLHGPAGKYGGRYALKELAGWAEDFSVWYAQGKDVYCYFDNDEAGYAAQNARELQDMVAGRPAGTGISGGGRPRT